MPGAVYQMLTRRGPESRQARASSTRPWKCATSRSDSVISRPCSRPPPRRPFCTRSTSTVSSAPTWLVELEHLLDPRLVDVRPDEVVEEAGRALRRRRAATGPIERFGCPGIMLIVRFGQRKWNWPAPIGPLGSNVPRGSSRTGPYCEENQRLSTELVGVDRDVDDLREARVGDLAVVALEEVLAADLPVRLVLASASA